MPHSDWPTGILNQGCPILLLGIDCPADVLKIIPCPHLTEPIVDRGCVTSICVWTQQE